MATIIMSADKVIEAANKVIESINNERNRRDEDNISRAMSKKRGIFKKYYLTREQAIDYLKSNHDAFFGWRSVYMWDTLSKAEALLKLANHGDPVTLNQDDIGVLF